MLVVHPIAGDQSRYYLEGPAPGRWVGGGSQDLGLRGAIDETSLRAVLAGHLPGGDRLLPARTAHRRDGFDLILAAPKSVSLVAAMADDQTRERFHRAHEQAVEATLGYLERDALRTRRGAEQRLESTSGLLAAEFQHTLSAAGDPHVHTHVVVANLVHGTDGKWSSMDSRSLYRDGRAAGAVYQANLRWALDQQGLRFEWTVDRHGLGDIVGVPRAAIEAASIRHRQVRAEIEAGLAGRIGRASAGPRTRRTAERDREPDSPGWPPRVAASGFDRPAVGGLVSDAATRHQAAAARVERPDLLTLNRLLSERHSRIRRADVVRAAAELSVDGAAATELEAVADRFLETAVDAGKGIWTTATLQRLEQQITAAVGLSAIPTPTLAVGARPRSADPSMSAQLPDHLDQLGADALARLTRSSASVDVVRGDLLAQAEVIEAARGVWEARGHRVALLSPTERGQARWQVLTGLERPTSGSGQPTVVIVDNADRWSTANLHQVVVDATSRQAKVVLLDGGSAPRQARAESPAMETLRSTPSVIEVGRAPPARTAGLGPGPPPRPVVRAGAENRVIVTDRMSAAVDQLVADWHQARRAGKTPRMVALGPEEAEHLNRQARAQLQAAGELKGPEVEVSGRGFQVGDDVLALRKDGRLQVTKGKTTGRVTAVDPERQQLTIQWSGRDDEVTVTAGKHKLPLAHGYATTPPYLRGNTAAPVLSWGHLEAFRPSVHPDRVYEVLAPVTVPARDPTDPMTALLGELFASRGNGVTGPSASASRSLSELADERDALAEGVRGGVPPRVPTSALRQLDEERAWLLSVPNRPDGAAKIAALDGRRTEIASAADHRRDWIENHGAQIRRWDDLARTIAWRESALGRAAEISPTTAVKELVGAPPADATERKLWRRAADRVEGYRERWHVADGKLDLTQQPRPEQNPARRRDELGILAATRAVERARGRERGHGLGPAGP